MTRVVSLILATCLLPLACSTDSDSDDNKDKRPEVDDQARNKKSQDRGQTTEKQTTEAKKNNHKKNNKKADDKQQQDPKRGFPKDIFKGLRYGDTSPTRTWVTKVLDAVTGNLDPDATEIRNYLEFKTRTEALEAIITDNEAGFKERLKEFGLFFIEFEPARMYITDPLTGEQTDGNEIHSFSNVKTAADEIYLGGNFLSILDFPWDEFLHRGHPASLNSKERLQFQTDFLRRPWARILYPSPNNRNRRRAAWVLKNFLCDDLAPVEIMDKDGGKGTYPDPKKHPNLYAHKLGGPMQLDQNGRPHVPASTGPKEEDKPQPKNLHAIEPSCSSCHWRLDYIAPFFRYVGTFGESWQGKQRLEFFNVEPFTGQTYDDYMDFWKTADGKKWNIGIRRGATAPHPNDWDATTVSDDPIQTDLFKFLKTAPELHQCVTKKMAHKFIGDNLLFNEKWLQELATHFTTTPEKKSGRAFLKILGSLVFSKTFAQDDPSPKTCYDNPSGQKSRIPCQPLAIISEKCVKCHRSTSNNVNFADLIPGKTPGTFRIEHEDDDGNMRSVADSAAVIMDRLVTDNIGLRMPQGQPPLTDDERKTFEEWLNTMIEEAKQ